MKTATIVARVLMGLMFLVFGLNFFFEFLTLPPNPPAAEEFMGALVGTGYLMQVVKGVEIVCGALLILGFFVPLALVLLAPGTVNIALFHTFLAPEGMPMGWGILAVQLFLMWRYRRYYAGVFTRKAAD